MILLDPKTAHRFQPDPGSEIVYLLKVPTVADRPKYRHAVRLDKGRRWAPTEMLDALADGVRQIVREDDPQLEPMLAEIAKARLAWTQFADEARGGILTADNPAYEARLRALVPSPMIQEIALAVSDHYPRYETMLADSLVYADIAAGVAARMFLLGWEGGEAPYTRGVGEAPDDVLSQIPLAHLAAIGAEIERLMDPEASTVKNYASGAGTTPDQTVLNGTETPRRNARSKTTSGPATSSASPN